MNRPVALLLAFALVASLSLQVPAFADAASGEIIVPDNCSTIQEAINSAVPGDTIYVRRGVYVENPIVNKTVSLVGEDRDSTVIDVTAGLKVESNNVTVTGFTIYDGWQGISVSGNGSTISGNKITDATHGIVVFGSENNITGNILLSIGLSSAIQLNFANRNLVSNNLIDSCVEGIQIWQNSNNNTIEGNTIINCQDTAINFQYSNDNMIVGNNISRSGLGTSIYGSNGNTITRNNYIKNAVQFSANESYYLTFGYNRSVNNINANYWSDYDGSNADGDGTGDIPYIIDDNNADSKPLMFPIDISTEISTEPSTDSNETPVEPFPTLQVATVAFVSVSVVSLLFLFLLKKRKQEVRLK